MACEGLLIELNAVMDDKSNPERAGGLGKAGSRRDGDSPRDPSGSVESIRALCVAAWYHVLGEESLEIRVALDGGVQG